MIGSDGVPPRFPLTAEDLPPLPDGLLLGGNELGGVLVRALRLHPRRRVSAISYQLSAISY
ncbi:MAG TPA: hypothetical protein VMO26_18210 [Vicinamibacterales bacterium]|nr:hypothetical protein [Vicinamibacterales bacterium]